MKAEGNVEEQSEKEPVGKGVNMEESVGMC